MPIQLVNALVWAIRGVVWLIYGPVSGLIPIFFLYGMIEFGLNLYTSRSKRERRLDIAMLISCALGVVVWLMRTHIPLILLALLALSMIATAVMLILAIRGKGRRKKRRRADRTGKDGDIEPASPEAEMAQL